MTDNAWKFTSWKIIKNSCCKNNLCEYLVRALIVFPSRSWSFPFIIVLPIWEGDSFLVCTSPSLLWLQLFVRYYACTNQGHNFLVREEFTVCMWELHRKSKRCMTAGVPAPISTVEIHTHMVNELPTYYGLCLCFCLCKYPGSWSD